MSSAAVNGITSDAGAATSPRSAASSSPAYTWYVILLLTVVNVFNYMDRMALSVLLPAIKADLMLSDGQLGLLVGFAFSLFYAVCGVPIARWADRGIRRNIIAVALASWSVMTALSGAAQNFWHLLAARVGVGAGEAGCIPASQSIICDYVPLTRRPAIFAVHNFGATAGVMVGMASAGVLVGVVGWRWTFVILGLPGIALALIVRLTLREPVREATFEAADPRPTLGRTLASLWHCKTYRLLTFTLIMSGFVQFGMNQWWPSMYVRVFGMSMASIGIYFGVAAGLGAGIGVLGGGFLANKLARRDLRLPLLLGAASTLLAMPLAIMALFASSPLLSISLVALTLVCACVPNGAIVASTYSVTMPHMRAMAGAVSIFFISVLGFGLGPFCVGVLSDILAPTLGVESLRYAMLLPIALFPVVVAALYASSRTLPRDLRMAGARIVVDEPPPGVRTKMAVAE